MQRHKGSMVREFGCSGVLNPNISHAEPQSSQRALKMRGYEGDAGTELVRILPDCPCRSSPEKRPLLSAYSASLREQLQHSGLKDARTPELLNRRTLLAGC